MDTTEIKVRKRLQLKWTLRRHLIPYHGIFCSPVFTEWESRRCSYTGRLPVSAKQVSWSVTMVRLMVILKEPEA